MPVPSADELLDDEEDDEDDDDLDEPAAGCHAGAHTAYSYCAQDRLLHDRPMFPATLCIHQGLHCSCRRS